MTHSGRFFWPVLRFLLLLLLGARGAVLAGEPPITTAREVKALSVEESSRGLRAVLTGTVFGQVNSEGSAIVLTDGTENLYVGGEYAQMKDLHPGDRVRLTGVTSAGGFAPILVLQGVERLEDGTPPAARPISSEELFSHILDATWVEIRGVVREVRQLRKQGEGDPGRPVLQSEWQFSLAIGDRIATVLAFGDYDPAVLTDATVRLQVLCFSHHNSLRQFVRPLLISPPGPYLEVLEPPVTDPESIPLADASALFQYSPSASSLQRVRLQGVVTHVDGAEGFWIRDGARGILVQPRGGAEARVGERVEVQGYPQQGPVGVVLAFATRRILNEGEPVLPAPVKTRRDAVAHHGDLVSVTGKFTSTVSLGGRTTLRLAWDHTEVNAVLPEGDFSSLTSGLVAGSEIEASGIFIAFADPTMRFNSPVEPDRLNVLVRGVGDVRVVSEPPLWSTYYGLRWMAALATLVAVVFGAVSIHHRVKLKREKTLREMESVAHRTRLRERTAMARDIHDTVAQSLVATSLQLQLADGKVHTQPKECATHLGQALAIVRESLSTVRGHIRALRDQQMTEVSLADALAETATRLFHAGEPELELRLASNPGEVASTVKSQVLIIYREILNNVVRHAAARRVEVDLEPGATEVTLRVTDNGCGFDPSLDWAASGHFGLLGMRERAESVGARIDISSRPGMGTTIALTFPRQFAEAVPGAPAPLSSLS